MCTYSRLFKNKKYQPNTKNGGIIPEKKSELTNAVPIKCGVCFECKRQKSREWSIRLQEEIQGTTWQFVTLTFSTEELKKIARRSIKKGYELDNDIAKKAVRRFLDRWRKNHGHSPKHWLVTELGNGRYEHMHIHGLIETDDQERIKENWKYGFAHIGKYVNERTCNYIVKYITKEDKAHKAYTPKIMSSQEMGLKYIDTPRAKRDKQLGYYTSIS